MIKESLEIEGRYPRCDMMFTDGGDVSAGPKVVVVWRRLPTPLYARLDLGASVPAMWCWDVNPRTRLESKVMVVEIAHGSW